MDWSVQKISIFLSLLSLVLFLFLTNCSNNTSRTTPHEKTSQSDSSIEILQGDSGPEKPIADRREALLPEKETNEKEVVFEQTIEPIAEKKAEKKLEPIAEKKAEPVLEKKPDGRLQDSTPRPFHPYYDLEPRKGQVGLLDATKLKPHQGNVLANKDGQVIENLWIKGSIYVQANRVTIRNCKIELGTKRVSAISVRALNGKLVTGLHVSRVEIHGGLVGVSLATAKLQATGGANANKLEYVYMHGVGDGVLGNDFTLYRSRIETVIKPWGQNHSDGVQVFHRGRVKIVDSYLDVGVDDRKSGLANAAVFIGQDYLPDVQEVHIQNSYLNGGGHIYRHWKAKAGLQERRPTKCSVKDSWFGRNSLWDTAVAYVGKDGSPVWSNNRYVDNGKLVSLTKR